MEAMCTQPGPGQHYTQTTLCPAATILAWASPLLRQLMWKSVFAALNPPQPPARCLGCGQASTCRLVIRNRIPPTVSMGMARKSSIAEPEQR